MESKSRSGETFSHPVALSTEGTLLENYNQGIWQAPYPMTEVDFERIKYGYSSWRSTLYNFAYAFLGGVVSVICMIVISFFDGLGNADVEPIYSGYIWTLGILAVICIFLFGIGYYFVRDKRAETLLKIEKHFQDTSSRPAIMRREK